MDFPILEDKRILVVDDEPDVLETVAEVLAAAHITASDTYERAQEFINRESFDLAILDIMGVDGFALLEACRRRKLPAAMLTAHSVNIESLNKAIRGGAVSFLPKEELSRLPELVAEILEGLERGESHWAKLFHRLGPFFKARLGVAWEDIDKSKFPPTYY